MRRVDPGRVRQRHQLVVQGVVQLVGQFVAGEADRGEQVGAADVADEQCVTGQHAVRHGVVGVLPDHDADRLGRVARRVAELELDVAERVALAVGEFARSELGAATDE